MQISGISDATTFSSMLTFMVYQLHCTQSRTSRVLSFFFSRQIEEAKENADREVRAVKAEKERLDGELRELRRENSHLAEQNADVKKIQERLAVENEELKAKLKDAETKVTAEADKVNT